MGGRALLAGLAGLAAFAALHFWTPPEDPALSVCWSRRLFHLPCPGCGLTRAFAHLAKGEWSAAVADHPLAPVLALELVLGWAAWGTGFGRRLALPLDRLLLANAALFFALWLVRLATGTLPW